MYSIYSLPGEVLDLVFAFLEPYDLKSLRLSTRLLHGHIGNSYIQHVVLTTNLDHLKSIESSLDSQSIARCITRLTFDCRQLRLPHELVRVIFPNDPILLILHNHERIGDGYRNLASRFPDLISSSKQIVDVLTPLLSIIRKLPSLRHVIVSDQVHYINTLPIPAYLNRELKAIHPSFAPLVTPTLTQRLVCSNPWRTNILMRSVILATSKAARSKCRIELRTLYARYGDGGGPTTYGLCDVVQHVDVDDTDVLVAKMSSTRRRDKRIWGSQFVDVVEGSPVIVTGPRVVPPVEQASKALEDWHL